jgi:hypothetical protein
MTKHGKAGLCRADFCPEQAIIIEMQIIITIKIGQANIMT